MTSILLVLLLSCPSPEPCEPSAEQCDNGVDDDCDGLVDCEDDSTCGRMPECAEDCANGFDDDGDGLADCLDSWCWVSAACDCPAGDPACPTAEACENGIDDNDNGATDCDDAQCWNALHCQHDWDGEICGNNVDDDNDRMADCRDPECDGQCPEVCFDGRDNDGDGLLDCEDANCADRAPCTELCRDGFDNDDDGAIDCWDDDCFGPECVGAHRTRVAAGLYDRLFRAQGVARSSVLSGGAYGAHWWSHEVRIVSARGTLQVGDGYGGVLSSCEWNANGWAPERHGEVHWPFNRSLEAGCAAGPFLPTRLNVDVGGGRLVERLWNTQIWAYSPRGNLGGYEPRQVITLREPWYIPTATTLHHSNGTWGDSTITTSWGSSPRVSVFSSHGYQRVHFGAGGAWYYTPP